VRRAPAWIVLGAATAALGWVLGRAGVPSSYLFAALLAGLAVALARPHRLTVADGPAAVAQAVTGVTLGTYLQADSLQALGDAWLPVTLVAAATLGVSIVTGLVLARTTSLDRPTATLGMIAGGASGIVAMAREMHGDDRLVAFMQYLRVLIVVLLTPLIVPLAFPGHHGPHLHVAPEAALGTPAGWALSALVAAAGAVAAVRLRVPAGLLLGPMVLAGALTLSGVTDALAVPPLLRETAFAVIGLQVGLGFTVDTVRQIGDLLVPVVAALAALLAACFGLAALLTAVAPVSLLDAYLATTPGGLYAVVAIAFGSGADSTFIVAVQGLRLLVMVLLAPLVVGRLTRPPAPVEA
jgi:membrane AbrB-like protein